MVYQKVSLVEKFSSISEHWRPQIVGQLNGQEIKLVKFKGEFVWHHHELEDECFLCLKGTMIVEFRDQKVELHPGELLIVPRGVEHRTKADEEVEALLFEPIATRNTGNVTDTVFTAAISEKTDSCQNRTKKF